MRLRRGIWRLSHSAGEAEKSNFPRQRGRQCLPLRAKSPALARHLHAHSGTSTHSAHRRVAPARSGIDEDVATAVDIPEAQQRHHSVVQWHLPDNLDDEPVLHPPGTSRLRR